MNLTPKIGQLIKQLLWTESGIAPGSVLLIYI